MDEQRSESSVCVEVPQHVLVCHGLVHAEVRSCECWQWQSHSPQEICTADTQNMRGAAEQRVGGPAMGTQVRVGRGCAERVA